MPENKRNKAMRENSTPEVNTEEVNTEEVEVVEETVAADPEPTSGVVTAKLLNFRDKPNMKSEILATLNEGASVTILEKVNDFYKVNTESGIIGFVACEFIAVV